MALKSKAFEQPSKYAGRLRVAGPGAEALKRCLSQRQEADLARLLDGGRRQPGSGAFPGNKGDVRSAAFLVECKRTEKASISLTEEWLMKILREAAEAGKLPALHFTLAKLPAGQGEWIAVPLHVFRALLDNPSQ